MSDQKIDAAEIGRRLLAVIIKVNKTQKRHNNLVERLVIERDRAFNYIYNHEIFSQSLGKKLKKDEGFIISHAFYARLFKKQPEEKDVQSLQDNLSRYDLHIAPIYKLINDKHVATFIIVHRSQYIAIQYADEMKEIIAGSPLNKNNKAMLIGAAMKIKEQFDGYNDARLTKYDIKKVMEKLVNDEAYFISKSFCMIYRINPKELAEYLSSNGFEIEILVDENKKSEEQQEIYREFDKMAGLVISKTNEGLEISRDKENLNIMFRASDTIDNTLFSYLQGKHSTESIQETLH